MAQIPSGAVAPPPVFSTVEDFIIPVDYFAVNAVDPPTDSFTSQQDVNDFLAANNTTAVKTLEAAWFAMALVQHSIFIQLNQLGGLQRPSDPTFVSLSGKTALGDGEVTIIGAPPPVWTDLHAAATITAKQVTNEVDGGLRNPWIDVSGTPFVPGTLQGKYAVFSNGLLASINNNTANRLFLSILSPNPSVGVDSVRVVKPSSVFRNSLDDVTPHRSSALFFGRGFSPRQVLNFEDITFEPYGASIATLNLRTPGRGVNILMDHDAGPVTPNGRGWQISMNSKSDVFSLTRCNVVVDPADRGNSEQGVITFGGHVSLTQSVLYGLNREAIVGVGNSRLSGFMIVIDNCATGNRSMIDMFDTEFSFEWHTSSSIAGVANICRNHPGTAPVWTMKQTRNRRTVVQQFAFDNNPNDCIEILGDCLIDMSDVGTTGDRGFKNGLVGGNGGVGINIAAGHSLVILSPNTNVSGSGGELEIEGVPATYAELAAVSPLTTVALNRLEKLT